MKAHPILFAAPMVRALLDGRKSQTRRVVKGVEIVRVSDRAEFLSRSHYPLSKRDGGGVAYVELADGRFVGLPCPFGKPGDLLWVRETWAPSVHAAAARTDDYPVEYAATAAKPDQRIDGRWRPSIHMPRRASRLTLRITGVRVERLQEISEADARTEGVEAADCWHAHYHGFSLLWQRINGTEAWGSNPWVWVLSFEALCTNVDHVLKEEEKP